MRKHTKDYPVGPGTLLWFFPAPGDGHGEGPMAAIVASVVGEDRVNLSVLEPVGMWFNRIEVAYLRKGEETHGVAYAIKPGDEAEVTEAEGEDKGTEEVVAT